MAFVIGNLVDHFGCSNLWFGSPDHPGADTARFIVPANKSREGVQVAHKRQRGKRVLSQEEILTACSGAATRTPLCPLDVEVTVG